MKMFAIGVALSLFFGGILSVHHIEAQEVGVVFNTWTGSETVITTEGVTMVIPYIHELYILESEPRSLAFRGNANDLENGVLTGLTVRSNDGASFYFRDMTVQYAMIPEMAAQVLREIGDGDNYQIWMLSKTREAVRNVFGQESTLSVSNTGNYGAIVAQIEAVMNEELNPHGIRIINMPTPEPQFGEEYEAVIEQRNSTEQERAVIDQDLARAATERDRQLAELDQEQNRIFQERLAELEGALSQAESGRQTALTEARATLTRSRGEANALVRAAEAQAAQLEAQEASLTASFQAQVDSYQSTGVGSVMSALSSRFTTFTINTTPIRQDANPASFLITNQ